MSKPNIYYLTCFKYTTGRNWIYQREVIREELELTLGGLLTWPSPSFSFAFASIVAYASSSTRENEWNQNEFEKFNERIMRGNCYAKRKKGEKKGFSSREPTRKRTKRNFKLNEPLPSCLPES